MANLNIVALSGNLTRDAVKKETKNGTSIIEFTIAVNKKRGDREKTNFLDITAYDKVGEGILPYLKKGKTVNIEGSLRQDRWEKDGQSYSRYNVVASNIQLVDGVNKNALNVVAVSGNIVRDAELSKTNSGFDIAKFTVAVNGFNNNSTTFVNATYFGKELKIAEYLYKGRPVNIAGELSQETWKTQDGQTRSSISIIVSHLSLLAAPKKEDSAPAKDHAPAPAELSGGPEDFQDDDIPF